MTAQFEQVALTGSTNADLLARTGSGAPEGLWLRADQQDGGRGRMGRNWVSPPGNLYASTIIRLSSHDPSPATLAFVAGLAAHETIRQIAPEIAIQLKWPNDVLTGDGAKLCGILLERAGDAIVAGFGINLVHHPENIGRPTANLRALGANPPDTQAVCEILATALAGWLRKWRQEPLSGLLRAWEAAAHPRGTALQVSLPDGESIEGLFAGLADDGALRLRLAGGEIRAIHAADTFLI
ncbi:MAG: biotin--[acetyl-CoA-carboxylase] ligase [Sphingomonadales bacterium]|nr:biotin--[acetyl-CoA-carboxylase] ligase [Sphingomonadales bacterium]MBK9003354.1 biotin--[acetyl-CoA-carboxylase] ligase [Sphingomonadales bacterium]MBK9268660.1 biotin--[acetyl-CoA-carboxylase] ligase [Sphingomonadales bacterium]MBP6434963.1 biotin--[acetyl-CoA-carboxylase] ligase [Sphingorhabdus sp.]